MMLMNGFLTKSPPKKTNDYFQVKKWKKRYFELKKFDDKYILEYRKSESSKVIKGSIELEYAQYLVTNFPFIRHRRNLFALKIVTFKNTRIFYFNAASIKEFDSWKNCLIECLNYSPSIMDSTTSEELILAGLFGKSTTKDYDEYVDMMRHSLNIFKKTPIIVTTIEPNKPTNKTTDKESVIIRNKCIGYYETRAKSNSSKNSGSLIPLPIRCTSTMSSGSSSNSGDIDDRDDDDDEYEVDNDGDDDNDDRDVNYNRNESNKSMGDQMLVNNACYKLMIEQSSEEPSLDYSTNDMDVDNSHVKLHYMDSDRLQFVPRQEPMMASIDTVDSTTLQPTTEPIVKYSEIDFSHTEALNKLKERLTLPRK